AGDPTCRLDPDARSARRQGEYERAAQRGVAGKRQLHGGDEDADLRVGVGAAGGQNEGAFGEVELARERLQRVLLEPARVLEDGQGVAGQGPIGEDVTQVVAQRSHLDQLAATSW